MDRTIDASQLARFERRVAGSDAERRAALALRERLQSAGRAAEIEPFRFHQRWALAQALAAGLAVVGSVLSVSTPAAGVALVALAAASSVLEAAGIFQLLSRLTGVRASQNVSSPPNDTRPQRPGLLVLAASYDAARTTVFGRVADRVRDPWLVLGVALLAVLACCLLRVLGVEGNGLTAVQLVPTLLLLTAVPLLVDAELSPVGDGATEAAGVGIAIALADRIDAELEQLDVWLVLTGAGGALGAGMRIWRRRHHDELNARPAVTIEVGAPEPDAADDLREDYADLARRLDAQLAGRG
jgi:hypothetical protein